MVAIANPIVRSTVSTSMRRLGIKVLREAPHLGVLFQPGAKTSASKASTTRWVGTVKRRVRARRLGARFGTGIFRIGMLLAATYGAIVAYPCKATLSQMRSAAAAMLGPSQGASVTARLAINLCGPGRDLLVKTIKT